MAALQINFRNVSPLNDSAKEISFFFIDMAQCYDNAPELTEEAAGDGRI